MILSIRQILFCLFLSTTAQTKSTINQVPPKMVTQLKIVALTSLNLMTLVNFKTAIVIKTRENKINSKGVEAALLAPTAVNQQKFSFEYVGMKDGHQQVRAKKGFSMIGYTKIDLGIAKYHFEVGAGKENFEWV